MDRVRAAGGGIRSAPHRHRSDQSKPDFLQRQHSGSGGFHRSAAAVAAVVVAPSTLAGEGTISHAAFAEVQLCRVGKGESTTSPFKQSYRAPLPTKGWCNSH